MQQRYYDPQIGRFLSSDPVATNTSNGGNFNRYSYANDNPYRFTDPDGRQSCESRDFKYPKAPDVQSKKSRAEAHVARQAQFGVGAVGASYAGMAASAQPGPYRPGYKFASGGFPSKPPTPKASKPHAHAGTVQIGLTASAASNLGLSSTAGLVADFNGNVGAYTETAVTAGPQADAVAGITLQFTNAKNIGALNDGSSFVANGGIGALLHLSGNLSYGQSASGDSIYGFGPTFGAGAGGGVGGGPSNTTIYPSGD